MPQHAQCSLEFDPCTGSDVVPLQFECQQARARARRHEDILLP
jgi:hypothetical protein